MSLLDLFRRAPDSRAPLPLDDVRRLGRLEAEVETLRLQWAGYRDEIKRLVNRLEKREQRAEARALSESALPETEEPAQHLDEVSRRVLARRNAVVRNGVPD